MTQIANFHPRGLGEIAIRVNNMPRMVAFYSEIIRLELLRGGPEAPITFFKIGEGFAGHTAVLALFDARSAPRPSQNAPVTGAASALHHIALSLPFAEQAAVRHWFNHNGQAYTEETFGWVGWHGIFTKDPEGNTVELVAFDPSLLD